MRMAGAIPSILLDDVWECHVYAGGQQPHDAGARATEEHARKFLMHARYILS